MVTARGVVVDRAGVLLRKHLSDAAAGCGQYSQASGGAAGRHVARPGALSVIRPSGVPAADLLRAPISPIDRKRERHKSRIGAALPETPYERAFCACAIVTEDLRRMNAVT